MAHFGANAYNYYAGQVYQDFDGGSMPDLSMAQQQYGQPDPLQFMQHSHLERRGRELPMQSLTKPAHNVPWNWHFRDGFQYEQQQFSPPGWQGHAFGTGAKTEPVPNHGDYSRRVASQKGSDVSDSAYASMPTSSVPQDNYNPNKKELEQDFPRHFEALKSEQLGNNLDIKVPNAPRSVKSEGHQPNTQHPDTRKKQQVEPCPVPGCGRRPKNPSDARKHELQHERPHRCTERDCEGKHGFATDNDLQRHRKSVHKFFPLVGSTAGYICKACTTSSCNAPGSATPKFWPRKDNFKAHIKRKHLDWDENHLIEVSKQNMRPNDARTAEEDNESVRSAMRACRRSQVDSAEVPQHHIPSNLCRNTSDQNDFNTGLPDSAIDMQQDAFAGMGGHTAEMITPYNTQYDMDAMCSADSNGPDLLSSGSVDYSNAMNVPPSKKPKLNHNYTSGNEAVPAFRMVASEHSTSSCSSNSQSTATSSSVQGEHKCPDCGKVKKRECDLKKHMKRHTRPYGCTFPNCQKKFGSRNDWKRHESSQHFLHEMWKCEHLCVDGTPCTRRPFRDVEALKRHLRGVDHLLQCSNDQIDEECKRYLLGREGHKRFWCGFCQCLVRQDNPEPNAWDARFQHIGDHFDKEGKDSRDWVCIEQNKPKRYILQGDGGEGKRKGSSRMGEPREEEDCDLSQFNFDGVGMNGFGGVSGYMGGYGNGYYVSADGGLKRKHSNADADAEGVSDDEIKGTAL